MKNKQETPSWFTGSTYSEGSVVLNPFSGDTYELNAVELSMYDFIMGCQHMWAMGIEPSAGTLDEFEIVNQTFESCCEKVIKERTVKANVVRREVKVFISCVLMLLFVC